MDYKKTDWNGLNNFLDELDWTPVLSATDPDQALGQWYRILSGAMQKFVPEKRIKKKTKSQAAMKRTERACTVKLCIKAALD